MQLRLWSKSDTVFRLAVVPGAYAPTEHISSTQLSYIARLSSTLVPCAEAIRRATQIKEARALGEAAA